MAGDLDRFRAIDARLPDHPPLGRLWIGLCHEAAFIASPPIDRHHRLFPDVRPHGFGDGVCRARLSRRCLCRGLVRAAGAGVAARCRLVLMPRLFGHAHLAALETMVNLTTTAVVLYLAEKWGGPANEWEQVGSGETRPRKLEMEAGPCDGGNGGAALRAWRCSPKCRRCSCRFPSPFGRCFVCDCEPFLCLPFGASRDCSFFSPSGRTCGARPFVTSRSIWDGPRIGPCCTSGISVKS